MAKINRTRKKGKLSELVVNEDPKSPISEKLRTLRTNILFSSVDEDIKTILVTSPTPGDGKSWVSSNLAIAFAQTGIKVLLIDGDLRKGRQHKIFKLSNEFGFSNYLLKYGKKTMINEYSKDDDSLDNDKRREINCDGNLSTTFNETWIPNLTVMTAGSVPPNPSELLGSKKMEKLFESIKKKYDIIIVDGPPVNIVTDSLILTRFVDTTVLVASVKKTQVKHLVTAKKTIENVGGKIAGIVVNRLPVTNGKQYTEYYEYYQRKEDAIKNNK